MKIAKLSALAIYLLLFSFFLPLDGHALSSRGKQQVVLPASGVWVRVPVIPWPNWKPGHRGLDIAAPIDTEVFAPATGKVIWVGRIGRNQGLTILTSSQVKHTLTGVESHLRTGKRVWAGQFIGWSITSQHCENLDCIHWSVRQNGRYLDPRWFLDPIIYRLPKKSYARG